MSTQTVEKVSLQYQIPGRDPETVMVNPHATVGAFAAKVAERFHLPGRLEAFTARSEQLAPETPLGDLTQKGELVKLSPDLTPA
jgi:hypothetical protein